MGYWTSWRTWKFYQEQVTQILALIKRKYNNDINIDQYLKICEELGEEPDPEKMPPDDGDFPLEVQLAFYMHSLMPDRWDGMSGSYLGKDWSSLDVLLRVHKVENQKEVLFFLKHIENESALKFNEKIKRKQDASMRKAKAGNAGINVKG